MPEKSFAELLPAYVQVAAIVVGGLWAYWTFFRQRSNEPATDIDVDVRFIGVQNGQHIIEVSATLANKSLVRHEYKEFRVNIRYLRADDPIKDRESKYQTWWKGLRRPEERIDHQLDFPHSIDERIGDVERYFGNAHYINPRQQFYHRYETFVPDDATFLRVHCRFEFEPNRMTRFRNMLLGPRQPRQPGAGDDSDRQPRQVVMDSQRVFAVPSTATTANARYVTDVAPSE